MKLLRPTGFHHKVAISMAVLLLLQTVFPVAALALTSGPTQPEFNEFEPVGTTQMVDLFSGDFTYNIPLFELPGPDGGYPFNLSYHSGITMDQEASWVGLGWSMNHGAITRTMRGLPDDFNGDLVQRKMDMLANTTWQIGRGANVELIAFKKAQGGGADAGGTDAEARARIGLGLGMRVMHNTYKGIGVGFSLSPSMTMLNSDGNGTFGIGASLGVSSYDGAYFNPSLSIGDAKGDLGRMNLSLSVSSREGAQNLSLGYSNSRMEEKNGTNKDGEKYTDEAATYSGGGATYSFNKASFSPQVAMPYRGKNFGGSLVLGLFVPPPIGIGVNVNVNYSSQKLRYKNRFKSDEAYGYLYSRPHDNFDTHLLDFNREKDGSIFETSSNLAIPVATPDVYTVMGQGTGGSYRPYRSDVGIFSDPYQASESTGGKIGFDANFSSAFDLGGDGGSNVSFSESGSWDISPSHNLHKFHFKDEVAGDPSYEPFYFKSAGEKTAEDLNTYDYIGGKDAVGIKLGNGRDKKNYDSSSRLEKNNNQSVAIDQSHRLERKPRSSSIQPLTKFQIINLGGKIKEYDFGYFDASSINDYSKNNLTPYTYDNLEDHHIAGITDLMPNGMRYVYGLPIVNLTQEDIQFSTDAAAADKDSPTNTNYLKFDGSFDHKVSTTKEYLNHNVIPKYVHTNLLTSVLGADYVDLDEIPGPSDGDYGYWVKFNYVKTADLKWKTPFAGANNLIGHRSDDSDNMGSILYGEREQYYLATAETKTHIAEFEIMSREDGRGAATIFQESDDKGAFSYKLKEIRLYSKLERLDNGGNVIDGAIPIKKVVFNGGYETNDFYDLCNHTQNSSSGKLTLKKLHFEYQNSSRGSLSPYEFFYSDKNPQYSEFNYDRWGTYQYKDGQEHMHPYSLQTDNSQNIVDENASAWSLNKIKLPSGASINIEYESDDYAYVQDRTAMQMFKIANPDDEPCLKINTNSTGGINNHPEDPLSDEDLKVYFELEDGVNDINQYFSDVHNATYDSNGKIRSGQIFFKTKVNLKNPVSDCLDEASDGNASEYVSGYAAIDDEAPSNEDVVGIETIGGRTLGFVKLKPIRVKKNKYHHPFAVTAWHYLKLNFPSKIAQSQNNFNSVQNEDGIIELIEAFASSMGEIKNLFKKYYKLCAQNEYGSQIDIENSFIRLNTPDKIKKGGGSRVKKVVLQDNWDIDGDGYSLVDDVPTYGQVYEYKTLENGVEISSGVASNEPSVGYEACALKYAKEWSIENYLKTDKSIFFEYPINESYLPGASVGYSEVRVKSLATHKSISGKTNNLPPGFATTGVTVNKFYTAKDYPIIAEETFLDKWVSPIRLIPLLVASFSFDKFTGSQGYAITLNDMHGKPKEVSHYERYNLDQVNMTEFDESTLLSKVEYSYKSNDKVTTTISGKNHKIKVLDNKVEVLVNDASVDENGDPIVDAVTDTKELGVDYDFFVDMREKESFSAELAFGLNGDYTPPFIFLPGGAPAANTNESRTRTAVTNKIIRQSGILEKTDAFDGQGNITTSNLIFDPLTGEPLLTTVNNSYKDLQSSDPSGDQFDKIYNYNIPARFAYNRMGAAYENWGTKFEVSLGADESCGLFTMQPLGNGTNYQPIPGDEFIITNFVTEVDCNDFVSFCSNRKYTFVRDKVINGDQVFLLENEDLTEILSSQIAEVMVFRSGNRNHLTAKSGSVTALRNPTNSRTPVSSPTNIDMPSGQTQSNIATVTMNEVLNASAVTYSDKWDLERTKRGPRSIEVTQLDTGNCVNILHFLQIEEEFLFDGDEGYQVFLGSSYPNDNNPSDNCLRLPGTQRYELSIMPNNSNPAGPYFCNRWWDSGQCFHNNTTDNNDCMLLGCTSDETDFVNIFPIVIYGQESNGSRYLAGTITGNNDYTFYDQILGYNITYFTQNEGCEYYDICPNNSSGGTIGTSTYVFDNENTKYEYGELGVWRPFQNYTYVDERNSSIDLSATPPAVVPNLQTDGDFDNFTFFNWQNPFFKYSTGAENWKETNRITKYAANGEEVENRDIIGLHSSALYAYKDNLPIAVAANASHYEIAFEGFETIELEEEKGNLDFVCSGSDRTTKYINNTYEIVGGYDGGDQVYIDQIYYPNILLGDAYALLVLEDENGVEYEATADITAIDAATIGTPPTAITNDFGKQMCVLTLDTRTGCNLPTGITTGKIVIRQEKVVAPSNEPTLCISDPDLVNRIAVASEWSHTGKKSLKIEEDINFNQASTELQPGKQYVISGWVSMGPNYDDFDLSEEADLRYDPGAGNGFISFPPSGPMINGWQRIEGIFTAEAGESSPDGSWTIGFGKLGSGPVYYDDIRIYPLDGNIQTYVYDPVNYRLSAVLDNNNYATFYQYDEEGNLFLVKKETAKGIKTIQETREYVKNTQ